MRRSLARIANTEPFQTCAPNAAVGIHAIFAEYPECKPFCISFRSFHF
jgi:hypothetical protein